MYLFLNKFYLKQPITFQLFYYILLLYIVSYICVVEILYNGVLLPTYSQLQVQWHHISKLKLVMLEIFTPKKWRQTRVFFPWRAPVRLLAHPWSPHVSLVEQGWSKLVGIKHQLLGIFQPDFLELNSSCFQIAMSLGVFPMPEKEDVMAKFSG